MAVTIYDVARKAGVGIGTVSRAMNNSSQIAPKTKEKILAAIKELKYEPHAVAQSLARKKTNMIAVIVPFFTGHFYFELLKGIQEEVTESSYDMILYNVDQIDKTESFLKRTLIERRVDGVLLISLQISDAYAKRFIQSQMPIVLVDSFHPQLDSIKVENEQGAFQATEYLINLGHTRIGMIDGQLRSMPAQVRLEGYQKALKQHGLSFNESYLVISDPSSEKDGFNREAGYQGMQKLLAMGDACPSAVFAASDIQAAGAIRAIKENGLKIPEDISIIGFDDIELSQYLDLTTVRQPMQEMGSLALHHLIEQMQNKTEEPFLKKYATELIIRSSCAKPSRP